MSAKLRFFGAERCCQIWRQFFRGDDVGADRNNAALELRRHIARVAIGGDDDMAARGMEPRGVLTCHVPPASCVRPFTGVREAMAMPAFCTRSEQALVVEGRVNVGGAPHHHAAAIVVGTDVGTLLVTAAP